MRTNRMLAKIKAGEKVVGLQIPFCLNCCLIVQSDFCNFGQGYYIFKKLY